MAEQQKMQMPGVFGGLMRYDDEYRSKFMLSPRTIIVFIAVIIVFVLVLKIFFPISASVPSGGVPTGHGGVWWSLVNLIGF
jgi:preprotein translocase subunit Sec61beta